MVLLGEAVEIDGFVAYGNGKVERRVDCDVLDAVGRVAEKEDIEGFEVDEEWAKAVLVEIPSDYAAVGGPPVMGVEFEMAELIPDASEAFEILGGIKIGIAAVMAVEGKNGAVGCQIEIVIHQFFGGDGFD